MTKVCRWPSIMDESASFLFSHRGWAAVLWVGALGRQWTSTRKIWTTTPNKSPSVLIAASAMFVSIGISLHALARISRRSATYSRCPSQWPSQRHQIMSTVPWISLSGMWSMDGRRNCQVHQSVASFREELQSDQSKSMFLQTPVAEAPERSLPVVSRCERKRWNNVSSFITCQKYNWTVAEWRGKAQVRF